MSLVWILSAARSTSQSRTLSIRRIDANRSSTAPVSTPSLRQNQILAEIRDFPMVQDKQPKRFQLIFAAKIKSLQISIKIGATTNFRHRRGCHFHGIFS